MIQAASIPMETLHFDRAPLPKGWHWIKLGDIAEYINGRAFKPEDWSTSGLPIIRIQNLNSPDAAFNYFAGEVEPRYLVNNGDLLISWSASLDAFIWNRGTAILNQHIFKVMENRDIIRRDFFYFVARETMSEIRSRVHGATMKHITKPEFERIEIPLPPLSEQERIASILKEQMAAVARARTAAEAQLKAAKDLPAVYLRSVFDSSEARQWVKKRIGDAALLVQNGIYKAAEHYGHGHPFLRMYNVQNNSWMLNLNPTALVNLEGKEEQTFALKCGDLLISRVNSFELVGKCAWVSPDAEGFVFENMLIRVQLDPSVNSLFVAQQMATDSVRKQIEAVAKRAIGQASINSTDLRAIEIALPPLHVQEQIANELSARAAGTMHAANALQDQLNTINKLPATLLRQAFTGKL